MREFILQYEPQIRMLFFFGVFAIMALWEWRNPRRILTQSKAVRWFNNISLVLLNSVLLRLIFPAAAVGMTVFVEAQGWGILNYIQLPALLEVILALILLDGAIYIQHVLFHAVPALWRLHRLHHTDMDLDVTSGTRFHPIEIILSMLIKFLVIAALGPSVVAVILFEILLNSFAMFNHSNVSLPATLDRKLRWLIVTPDMHRVHHSVIDYEANSNYGFSLSIWDRIFGTYIDQPEKGHDAMDIGVNHFRDSKWQVLPWMIIQPFSGKVQDYVINRRQWKKDENNQSP